MDHHKPHWSQGYSLRINIGLTVSLALVLAAFEWKTPDESIVIDRPTLDGTVEEVMETIPTRQEPPKLVMKVQPPDIVESPIDIVEVSTCDFMFEDFGKNKVAVMEKVKPYEPALKEEEIEDEMLIDVEVSAEPTGGYEAFYQYIKQELKYPSQAQRVSVQGKVYVQFIIERDGSLSDVKVLKGIGAGCDEEAVRVLSQSPSWQPGKQRGRPVRQRMVMPLVFKLQ